MNGSINGDCPEVHLAQRILIACIGNIFLGDDGFGVEVARRLSNRQPGRYPETVQVIDFGIRGMDLAYTLLEGFDTLVLVDTVSRGGTPGTLYLLEPDLTGINATTGMQANSVALDTHSMDPVKVLAFARSLGASHMRTLLVACEAIVPDENADPTALSMGLSEPITAAVDEAVHMLDTLVENLLTVNNPI